MPQFFLTPFIDKIAPAPDQSNYTAAELRKVNRCSFYGTYPAVNSLLLSTKHTCDR